MKEPNTFWIITALVMLFLFLASCIFIFSIFTRYAHSETENYNTLANYICKREQLGGLQKVHIRYDKIVIECYGGSYNIEEMEVNK